METTTAILLASGLATIGWLYSARRARSLSRKQHTVNVLMLPSFNSDFQHHFNAIRGHLRDGRCPDDVLQNDDLWGSFRTVLNHYEFLSVGIRNGDFDELLVKDSQKSSIVGLFKCCERPIHDLRSARGRMSVFEHLEWLNERWHVSPPNWAQRVLEWCLCRPLRGKRKNIQPPR